MTSPTQLLQTSRRGHHRAPLPLSACGKATPRRRCGESTARLGTVVWCATARRWPGQLQLRCAAILLLQTPRHRRASRRAARRPTTGTGGAMLLVGARRRGHGQAGHEQHGLHQLKGCPAFWLSSRRTCRRRLQPRPRHDQTERECDAAGTRQNTTRALASKAGMHHHRRKATASRPFWQLVHAIQGLLTARTRPCTSRLASMSAPDAYHSSA